MSTKILVCLTVTAVVFSVYGDPYGNPYFPTNINQPLYNNGDNYVGRQQGLQYPGSVPASLPPSYPDAPLQGQYGGGGNVWGSSYPQQGSSFSPNALPNGLPNAASPPLSQVGGFVETFRWKQFTITPPENDGRSNDLSPSEVQNSFIQYNNFPMGMVHHKNRIFVGIPRRNTGIPATLSYFSSNEAPGSSPSLRAYPNYRSNQMHPQNRSDPNRIVSVYRPRVDKCERLWFVDTGNFELTVNPVQIQPPSVWIFDLKTDQLVRRAELPLANVNSDGHGLASIIVDIDDNCNDAYAYIADLVNFRLHVYSFRTNQFWTFSHNYFRPDPLRGDFNVAGAQYQWTGGIFSITLSERNPDGFKTAFFHAMASITEFTVSTQILKNQSLASRSFHGTDFKPLGDKYERGQGAMHVYDKNTGIILFSQNALNGIACWDTSLPLTPSNFHLIAQDNTTMIYPTDLSMDSDGIIWLMTDNLPVYQYSTINTNEYNYRIWKSTVQQATRGTLCDKQMYRPPVVGYQGSYK